MSIEQTAAKPANLLVATDLSARSDRAVERTLLLARQMRAGLTILHVVEADRPGGISDRRRDEARGHRRAGLAARQGPADAQQGAGIAPPLHPRRRAARNGREEPPCPRTTSRPPARSATS